MIERIRTILADHQEMISRLTEEDIQTLAGIAKTIVLSVENGGKILLAGNGGSAADAQHIAGEFIGRFQFDRSPIPAMALSADTSVLTCVANDYTFDEIYARQVAVLAKPGDIFWILSTSGNSRNILRAAAEAKQLAVVVIAFTGQSGGELKKIADLCFCSPHTRSHRIQELHVLAYHVVCELVEEGLNSGKAL